MCALSVCLFYYACSADCHGFYWALLVPRHWFFAPFNFWPCFVSAAVAHSALFPVYLQYTRGREGTLPNAVLFWNFKRTASDSICQSAACWWIYGSTAAAGWEKRAMMDFDGYVSLQKCWMAQSKYLCVYVCVAASCVYTQRGQDCIPCTIPLPLSDLWFSELPKELAHSYFI